jgi:RsiW-degrading membrane proteinase PrsW (M82 family)
MNIIISGCKKLYHLTSFSIGLIHKNFFLFGRLVLLSLSSIVAGILIMPLLSFFDEGTRHAPWYILHIAFLGGLLVSATFVAYLIIHILEKQTHLDVKRAKAEHKVRAHEQEYVEPLRFYGRVPILTRLLESAKNKLLPHLPDKKEDE